MANLDNIKIGNNDSERIMFDTYYNPKANETLIFGSTINKDNSKVWNSVYGEWQINDGWEVEILDSKRIAIKKFRIDTWGLRKIWNKGNANDTDSLGYKDLIQLKVKVTGLDYVHNNVVYQEDSEGNKTYGFVKAFAGTGGYNVYWYPGQFTSGNYIQGLGIQSGIGYTANANEIEDSLQMGKHPWDIGGRTCITDDIFTGSWSDSGYRATTIGLYGGYQTATKWHEYNTDGYSGNAYKIYDISDNPIIIDLEVPNTNSPTDVSTIECWDAYVGTTKAYHKDKTRDNCWKRYGIMFPENYNLVPSGLTLSNTHYIKWVASNKFRISRIPEDGLTIIRKSIAQYSESVTPSYQGFSIGIYNKSDTVKAKFERTFTNVSDSPGGEYKDYNVEYELSNGITDISSYSQKMYLIDRNAEATLTEFKLSFEGSGECNILVELIPVFIDGNYVSVNINNWNILPKLTLPEVTDKISDMTKTLWNSKIDNTDFWNDVKTWYENNYTEPQMLQHGLFRSSNIDEIKIRLNSTWNNGVIDSYLWSNGAFQFSTIKKIVIESVNGCSFSVGNRLFSKAGSLETIEIILNENRDYMVGATDFSGMFEQCGSLKTFPSNLINYAAYRSHAFDQGIPCSLTNYFFDYGSIETIPMYGTDRYANENTLVMHRSSTQAFNIGDSLKYLGPVIDMILVRPTSGCANIFRIPSVTDARIKNLNHGSWNLDGVVRGLYHGDLSSLDAESVEYLFSNLMDLTTCNPETHEETIDKCFKSWGTSYADSWDTEFWTSRVAVRYFETRNRNAEGSSPQTIVYTNKTFENMTIEVEGLQEGDRLEFGSGIINASEKSITSDGIYQITKTNTNWEGFMLYGNTSDTENIVKVIIENGLDYTNPLVSSANLYCPSTWEEKITNGMITSANAKGWNIYIGGMLVTI